MRTAVQQIVRDVLKQVRWAAFRLSSAAWALPTGVAFTSPAVASWRRLVMPDGS